MIFNNFQSDEALEKIIGNSETRLRNLEQRKLYIPNTVVTDELNNTNFRIHLEKHFINQESEESKSKKEQQYKEKIFFKYIIGEITEITL